MTKKNKKEYWIFMMIAIFLSLWGVNRLVNNYEEQILLSDTKPALEVYFKKYYNNVKSIDSYISLIPETGTISVSGYVNHDKKKWFSFNIYPENNKVGFVHYGGGMSGKLDDMEKYEYDISVNPKAKACLSLNRVLEEKLDHDSEYQKWYEKYKQNAKENRYKKVFVDATKEPDFKS